MGWPLKRWPGSAGVSSVSVERKERHLALTPVWKSIADVHIAAGIDPAAGAVQAAKAHAAKTGVTACSYITGSAYSLPFDDEHFDGVVSSDVLEHLEDVPACLGEIFRVLKPGGVFVFDTISRTTFSWYYTVLIPQHLLRIMPRDAHDWRMYITPEELRRALKQAGFEVSSDAERPEWRGMGPTIRWPHQALWRAMRNRSLIGAIGPWQQVSGTSLQGLNASYLGWARKPGQVPRAQLL